MNEAEAFRKAIMKQAYLDFLSWACTFDPILAEFTEATGKKPNEDFEAFRVWVTENYWGEIE